MEPGFLFGIALMWQQWRTVSSPRGFRSFNRAGLRPMSGAILPSGDLPMFLSVIVPTYRRPDTLAALLVELCSQIALLGDDGAELIVVDNCPDRSAEPTVAEQAPGAVYVHEPRSGVVHARNAGVRGSQGRYLVFIDDDQRPVPGWLESYRSLALLGHAACFGPVYPTFEAPPPTPLRPLLEGLFSRDAKVPTGTDITDKRAYLGTGNSMFERERCFVREAPFDPRFNRGGEDVWFLRELVQDRGLRLTWSTEAAVHENVPAARMTAAYVLHRRFRNGQLRCLVEAGGRNWGATAFWMVAGFAQTVIFGAGALASLLVARPQAVAFSGRAAGGLGKVFWWVRPKA
ncbi:MAG: glycosyltransferase [bacterium]